MSVLWSFWTFVDKAVEAARRGVFYDVATPEAYIETLYRVPSSDLRLDLAVAELDRVIAEKAQSQDDVVGAFWPEGHRVWRSSYEERKVAELHRYLFAATVSAALQEFIPPSDRVRDRTLEMVRGRVVREVMQIVGMSHGIYCQRVLRLVNRNRELFVWQGDVLPPGAHLDSFVCATGIVFAHARHWTGGRLRLLQATLEPLDPFLSDIVSAEWKARFESKAS
jgi:hypothetical protein